MSITTQFGSHVLKSKAGQPPAPGTLVTAPTVVDCPPTGGAVAAHEQLIQPCSSTDTQAGSQLLKSNVGHPPAPGTPPPLELPPEFVLISGDVVELKCCEQSQIGQPWASVILHTLSQSSALNGGHVAPKPLVPALEGHEQTTQPLASMFRQVS